MPDTLLAPHELADVLDSEEFGALPYEKRQTVLEKGAAEASQWVTQNGGWTPETWQTFGTAINKRRQTIADSETFGEKAKYVAGTIGNVVKDSLAIGGTVAAGLSPVLPDGKPGWGVTGQVPGETLVPMLGQNLAKLDQAVAGYRAGGKEPIETSLEDLRTRIDAGQIPFDAQGFTGWLDAENEKLRTVQRDYYQKRQGFANEGAPAAVIQQRLADVEPWLKTNDFSRPENAAALKDYLTTRNPSAFDRLRKNLLETPDEAAINAERTRLSTQTPLGRALKPEAQSYIQEAADPAELAGTAFGLIKGAGAIAKGLTKTERATELGLGAVGEVLSEQVSQTMDDPNATPEQRWQVVKDSLAGALGLAGLGAGMQAVSERIAPVAEMAPMQTGNPQIDQVNAVLRASGPNVELPMGNEGASDEDFDAFEQTRAPAATAPTFASVNEAPEAQRGSLSPLEGAARNDLADATDKAVGEAQGVVGSTPAAGTTQPKTLAELAASGAADQAFNKAAAREARAEKQKELDFLEASLRTALMQGMSPQEVANTEARVQLLKNELFGNTTPAAGTTQPPASQRPATTEAVPSIDNIGTKFQGVQETARPVIPDHPLGYRDVLDFLNENPITAPRSNRMGSGEYDWAETVDIPKYYRQFIISEGDVPNIDELAMAAWRRNLIPQPTADALMAKVQEDIGARRTYRVQGREQKAELLTREKQTVSFDKSQTKLGNKPTAMQVPFEALATGDQLTIDGEQVTVRAVESDEGGYLTKVVLEDGKKFGVQEFNPQNREGVFVDAFDPKPRLSGDPEVFSPAQAGGAVPSGLTEGDEVMDYHRSDKNGSSYLHIKDAKRRWFSVRVADHSQRTSDPYNRLDLYKNSRNATHGITQEFPIEISILVDEPLSERKTKALALAALSEIDDQTRTAADEDGDDFNFDARVKYHEKWLDWANEQVARNPSARGMTGVRDYLRDSPAKLIAARALIQKSQSTPQGERAMLGREPSKTGRDIAPPSPAAVNPNLNPAALESPARGLGRGLGDMLGQPRPGAPASQRPATTSPPTANAPAMSQALFDQARAVTSQQPDQPVELDELFTRARNLLANDGSMELRPSDRTVIPQALAKLAAGENPQLIVNQWKEHRNQVLMGQTTASTPFAEYAQAAVVKDSLTTAPGTARARLLSAYTALDRTGQGNVQIPDLVRASGLPIADVREVLIDLSDRGQAYLTPADEPRNIPAGDRSLLVVGPSGPSLYVTLPDPAALASPAQSTAQDAAYMAAVEAGDMATAQRMVDEAAKAAGYDIGPVWHGGTAKNTFDPRRAGKASGVTQNRGFWFSTSPYVAETYRNEAGANGTVVQAFLRIKNLADHKPGSISTDNAEKRAWKEQRDGFVLRQDRDGGDVADTYLVFDPQNIKSADPVTRDEQGNVIPLSQRFNAQSDSILYSPSSRTVFKRNTALNKAELVKLGLPTNTPKSVWGQKPVKAAMTLIAKDARLPATVRRMAKLLQDADLTGLFLRVEADGRRKYTGLYQPLRNGQGELVINLRHLGVGNVDPALNMAETLVHEVLHHATYRAVRGPKNDVQKSAIGNLEQLRRRVKAVLGSQQMADFDYQTSNIDEFIAALFTQKPFQDALAAIPAEVTPKTLVQQVRTLLDEAFRLLAEIVTGQKVPPGSVLDSAFQNALRLVQDGVRVAGTEKVGAPLANAAQEGLTVAEAFYQEQPPVNASQGNNGESWAEWHLDADKTKTLRIEWPDDGYDWTETNLKALFEDADIQDAATWKVTHITGPDSYREPASGNGVPALSEIVEYLQFEETQPETPDHEAAVLELERMKANKIDLKINSLGPTFITTINHSGLSKSIYAYLTQKISAANATDAVKSWLDHPATQIHSWSEDDAGNVEVYMKVRFSDHKGTGSGNKHGIPNYEFIIGENNSYKNYVDAVDNMPFVIAASDYGDPPVKQQTPTVSSEGSSPVGLPALQQGADQNLTQGATVSSAVNPDFNRTAPLANPSQAVPLKPEFGGAFPDYTPYQAKERQAWAAQEIANVSAEQLAQRVEAGQYGPVDKPFVLAAGLLRAEQQVRAATTTAAQIVAQTEVNRLRDLLNPQNSLAGQTLAAQRDALGTMRDRLPGLAVNDAVEKAQKQTIDAAVPVQPTVDGLDGLTTQASTEATETLAGALGADEMDTETDSTPQEQAAGDAIQAELQRLRQEVTAGRNLMSSTTAIWQRVLETFKNAGARKGALVKGLKDRVDAIRAARANTTAANKLKALPSPAQGITAPALPATAVEDGFMALVETGLDIDAWKAAMTKTLGPQYAAQLDTLYGQSLRQFEQELKVVDVASQKAATTKRQTKKTPQQRKARAQTEEQKARKVADGILTKIAETHSDPPIWKRPTAENPIRKLYREHVKAMAELALKGDRGAPGWQAAQANEQATFAQGLQALKVPAGLANTLAQAANLEINARAENTRAEQALKLREELERLLKDSPALQRMINQLRSTITGGLNWKQIFTSTATAQRQWELDTYAQIRQNPQLQGLKPEEARELTRELSKAWQRERRKVWKRELDKTLIAAGMAKPKHRAKIEASAPRLLSLINLGALNAATFRDAVAKEFGLKSMTDAEVGKIKEAAEKLQSLTPGTVPHRKAGQKFIEGLESLSGLSKTQLLESWWTAAVLSGWRTQVDIALGVANAMEDVGFGSVVTAVRTGNYGVASRALFASLERAAQALPEAFHLVLTGNRSLQASYDAEIKAALEDGYTTMGHAGRALMSKGGWRKAPGSFLVAMGRIMSALDHVTSSAGRAGALWMARANHPEIYKAAANITAQDRAAARAQALQILTGGVEPTTQGERLEVKRYTQELLDARHATPTIDQQASDVGLNAALQGDPTGIGGLLYEILSAVPQKLDRLPEKYAKRDDYSATALKVLRGAADFSRILFGTKFVRTAGNALNRATSYVPGIGAVNYKLGTRWGTPTGDVLMAKQMVGLLVGMGLLYALKDREEDDDMGMEGGWSGLTPEQRGQLLAQGKQPYSVWYRDGKGRIKSINYQQWGISNILAMVGTMQDQRRYLGRDMDAEMILTGIGYGLWAIADKAQLSGLGTVLGQDNIRSSTGEDLIKRLNKWASMTVGGLVPRLAKDIDQVMQPQLTRTDHWWQAWAREVPILRPQSSGVRVDIFGRPIELKRGPLSRIYQTGLLEPEYQVLGALNQRDVWISDPSAHPRKIKLTTGSKESRDMTPLEKDRYAREAGRMTKEWLLKNRQQLMAMDPEAAQDLISKRTETIRKMAVNAAVRR
jgi:hypothetical protein